MMRLIFAFLTFTVSVAAQCCNDYSFYIKMGTGICCSQSAEVTAPNPPWSPSVQGYDANLGNCAIASFSVGCELMHVLDLEVNISNRSTFEYRKFQTPIDGGDSYTRRFDLNVTPILFAFNFLGKRVPYFHWDVACGKLYPVVGAAVGVSNLLITDFRTTGLPATGDSFPYNSFTSENQYTLRKNFTYTILAGLEYNHNDYWAIGTGYRWFNAGHFNGPRYLRAATGAAVDVDGDRWKMRFRANEWFFELKIFI